MQDLEKSKLSRLGTDQFAFALGPSTQGQIGYFSLISLELLDLRLQYFHRKL